MRQNRSRLGNVTRFFPTAQLKKMDMFAGHLPTFNIKGEQTVSTCIGGLISLIILCVTFIFALMKL